MIENRLKLNKKPVYELPDEVIVGAYHYSKDKKRYSESDFEPDIVLNTFGNIDIKKPKETCNQIWIKTQNKELINFIKEYDWEANLIKITNAYNLSRWQFKKIILEEFYNKK